MPLKVTVTKKEKGIFTLSPVGSIDSNTYSILEKEVDAVLRMAPKAVIFDMKEVNYVSSAGIRVILKAEKALKLKGGDALMTNLQVQVKKVFEIVNALPPEQIFTSIQELDKYLIDIQRKIKEEGESF